jgi:hypothetical protein
MKKPGEYETTVNLIAYDHATPPTGTFVRRTMSPLVESAVSDMQVDLARAVAAEIVKGKVGMGFTFQEGVLQMPEMPKGGS